MSLMSLCKAIKQFVRSKFHASSDYCPDKSRENKCSCNMTVPVSCEAEGTDRSAMFNKISDESAKYPVAFPLGDL
jgi:hypothetical protein